MFLRKNPSDIKNLQASHTAVSLGLVSPPLPGFQVPGFQVGCSTHKSARPCPQPLPAHGPAQAPPKYLQCRKLSSQSLLCSLLTQLFSSIVEKLGTEFVSA